MLNLAVRQLLPRPDGDAPVDLPAAYAFPPGPWVRANMVASVDGAGALGGTTRRLSSDADRAVFALLRQLADVILVGAGTVRAERYEAEPIDPAHQAERVAAGQSPAPAIAVISRSLDLDPSSKLFVGASTRTIVITCTAASPERRRALDDVADIVDAGTDTVDVGAAVDALHSRGLDRISCEGGPHLLGQLVAARRLDELCLTFSPLLVGGITPRLLAEQDLGEAVRVHLAQLLVEDDSLFARYLVHHGDGGSARA